MEAPRRRPAPAPSSQNISTHEDTPLGITLTGSDVDGDGLSFAVVDGATHGTLSGTAPTLTYTPEADSGPDSFTFVASDGSLASAPATVSITVTPVNDAPVAVADVATAAEGGSVDLPVLANDSDVEGNSLTAVLGSGPSHGTLTPNPNGSFTYTPTANYNGSDSFTYKANDGTADSGVASVAITVTAGNDAPVASNDSYTTAEDTVTSPDRTSFAS